eukprot:3015038-Pyramimonas_sp.AAC.1
MPHVQQPPAHHYLQTAQSYAPSVSLNQPPPQPSAAPHMPVSAQSYGPSSLPSHPPATQPIGGYAAASAVPSGYAPSYQPPSQPAYAQPPSTSNGVQYNIAHAPSQQAPHPNVGNPGGYAVGAVGQNSVQSWPLTSAGSGPAGWNNPAGQQHQQYQQPRQQPRQQQYQPQQQQQQQQQQQYPPSLNPAPPGQFNFTTY